ncbi:SRPBCC family protein [Allonocardiopsis opalescens]|uniref:Activator of Hsp90 ATPase-like protein n=1 Tax=Allonocardiopsis opalescens TaxID=1144618 RepID=A0A2T0Q9V5_9ACTN|nr:SRPBCC family protein [Allonocardiopsis opalescens]PRY00615.1 activator of Hsp90 ATPase-like protein [Allonocardiopsis opalescens]
MSTESVIAVHRAVTVPLDPDRAFELFTARMSAYWPREHSIGTAPLDQVVVEPRAGGRWYERGTDGGECDWGRVAVWEPPGRVVLLWQIGADWRFDPGLETEVHVSFTEEEPGRTRVDIEHRHLERYGEQAAAMQGLFESPGAWTDTLTRFARLAE